MVAMYGSDLKFCTDFALNIEINVGLQITVPISVLIYMATPSLSIENGYRKRDYTGDMNKPKEMTFPVQQIITILVTFFYRQN